MKIYKEEKRKMDNNFNQMNDQVNNDMNGQVNNQMNTQNAGISAMLTNEIKSFDVTKTLIGSVAALVATILSTILWVFITGATGTMFFFIAVGIAFLAVFAYEKISKKLDIIGIAICLVLVCIGIYFGVRYGYINFYAKEYDITMKQAKALFELAYRVDDSFSGEYVRNMIFSYLIGLGYGAVVIIKKYNLIDTKKLDVKDKFNLKK